MKINYLDSSILAAILLEESSSDSLKKMLSKQETIQTSSLTEAEILAVCAREDIDPVLAEQLLDYCDIITLPNSIRPYIKKVIQHGYVRGADLFHLAYALCLCKTETSHVTFWTLDEAQRKVADLLGFNLPKILR